MAAEPLPVTEIAPGVFVYEAPRALADPANEGAIANVGFVIGGNSVAVIDTGNSRIAGERLLAALRVRTDLPVAYVINTHMHPDHVLGNAAFIEEGGAVVGHYKLERALAARAGTYLEASERVIGEDAFAGTEIVPPDIGVEDRLELDLGGRVLELTAYGTAHTDNDLTVLDRKTGTAFLGDLLFMEHVPVIDGSLLGWLKIIGDLEQRRFERVVPGHGPASAPWPDAVQPQKRYLETLRDDARRLIDSGATMSDADGEAGMSEQENWVLFNEFNPRNAIAAYHELEWE